MALQESYFAVPPDPSFVYPISDFPPEAFFETTMNHAALIVPAKRTAELRKTLKDVLMRRPKIKSIYNVEDNEGVENPSQFRKMVLRSGAEVLREPTVVKLLEEDPSIQTSSFTLTVSYSDWSVEDMLKRLLPFDEVPSSFEAVGHIAHLNLNDEWLPFQYIVGKVILDKNQPRIKTVVNKLGQIETKYRTFGMKVIAGWSGPEWSIVKMKEEGCIFELDFQKVYWNSRLSGEHRRLVHLIRKESPGGVVADVMAGVGPFAVPLTADKLNPSKIVVHANDLNPSSYEYLRRNAKHNKCCNLHTYNMDGRAFIHQLQDVGVDFGHAIMNLPATAPEFLDSFRGFMGKTLPQIHVHCFGAKDEDVCDQVVERCSRALGCDIVNPSVHLVRDVAPKKNMYCVSFLLPEAARALPRIFLELLQEEPEAKRARIEN
jgi:tRNA (guanine37-N1)-methyltransferase